MDLHYKLYLADSSSGKTVGFDAGIDQTEKVALSHLSSRDAVLNYTQSHFRSQRRVLIANAKCANLFCNRKAAGYQSGATGYGKGPPYLFLSEYIIPSCHDGANVEQDKGKGYDERPHTAGKTRCRRVAQELAAAVREMLQAQRPHPGPKKPRPGAMCSYPKCLKHVADAVASDFERCGRCRLTAYCSQEHHVWTTIPTK